VRQSRLSLREIVIASQRVARMRAHSESARPRNCPHRESGERLHASLAINGAGNANYLNVFRFRPRPRFTIP
jgi:hypothetical protein